MSFVMRQSMRDGGSTAVTADRAVYASFHHANRRS